MSIRGRVLARDGERLRVRGRDGNDHVVNWAGAASPGDLIEISTAGAVDVIRPYEGGDYPGPESEVARLSASRLQNLRLRQRALTAVRGFFAERGFVDIEVPTVVSAPGLELHVGPIPAGSGWLITSPEYQMKRLLAAGMDRIFTVCPCFRAEEEGAHHSSEFTMLEWYRGWSTLAAVQEDTQELVAAVARTVRGEPLVSVAGRDIDVSPPWPVMTVADAFSNFVGIELGMGEAEESFAARLRSAGVEIGAATAWDDLFYAAFVERVDPALAALERPLFLCDWPVELAALARTKPGQPGLVERFEAYVGGIELANAFGELTCPVEQRARFEAELAERGRRGLVVPPLDEKLLSALAEGLPPCAGIALGVDRLVMLVTGAETIRDVRAFVTDEL